MLRVCCFLLGLIAAAHGACPQSFQQVGEGCYYFSYKDNLMMDWMQAREYCQALGDAVDLAVLDNLCNDYHHLANYLLGEDIHTPMERMYIGADGYDASWFWVDGSVLSANAIYWYEKNPTEGPGCVYLVPTQPHSYKKIFMSKDVCTIQRYFICQNGIHARV